MLSAIISLAARTKIARQSANVKSRSPGSECFGSACSGCGGGRRPPAAARRSSPFPARCHQAGQPRNVLRDAALEAGLFRGRALGRRDRLEPLVRDRLTALDREAVVPSSSRFSPARPPRGPRAGRRRAPRRVSAMYVSLPWSASSSLSELLVDLRRATCEQRLDAPPLGSEKLSCTFRIHAALRVPERRRV